MKKYLLHYAFGVGLVLSLFAGIPLNGGAYNFPNGLNLLDSNRYDLRIAYALMTEYDWSNSDGLTQLSSVEAAPCVPITEFEGGYLIPDFYGNLPLMISVNHDAGTASIPYGIQVFSDSVIGFSRNRVDSVRSVALLSFDYLAYDEPVDVTGTIDEDGSITFNQGNGFLYFSQKILRTYRNGYLQSIDTLWSVSPVFEGLTLFKPNGEHRYEQVYYTAGMDPLTPDVLPDIPNSSGHVKPTGNLPCLPDSLMDADVVKPNLLFKDKMNQCSSWIGGSGRPIKPVDDGGGFVVPPGGGGFKPVGGGSLHDDVDFEALLNGSNDTFAFRPVFNPDHWFAHQVFTKGNVVFFRDGDLLGIESWVGGSGRPIKPGDGWGDLSFYDNGGTSILNLVGGSTFGVTTSANNNTGRSLISDFKTVHEGFDGTCGFGRGGSGRPIKPITGNGDLLTSSNSGDNQIVKTDVTTKVYMLQYEGEENDKYVCVLNLYGAGLVNRFKLGENGALDFPSQPIGVNAETGDYVYNYSAPTCHIDQLESGNSGAATSDSLSWGVTVPFNPNETGGGDGGGVLRASRSLNVIDMTPVYYWDEWPYYYDNNRLYFTDGKQFDVPEPEVLNVSAVANKIDSALRGESSIGEVTDIIDKLLNSSER